MQRRKFLADATVASVVAAMPLGEIPPHQSSETKQTAKGFVVKSGKSRFGEQTRLFGINPNDIKVSAKDNGGNLTIFEYSGREKGGPPLHVNLNQEEIFYVIEGSYLFELAGERHKLTAGDLIVAPRKVPHTFAQLTDTGRMVFLLQPSGKMEDYFRTLGKLTGKLSPQEGAKLFAEHDMQIVGPPLPVE